MRILLVSTTDSGGGAEISAWNLFKRYRTLGHESYLAVGTKRTDDPHVVPIPNEACRSVWAKFWIDASRKLVRLDGELPGSWRIRNLFRWIGEPGRSFANARGHEDFSYPGVWKLPELTKTPDLIHCHNLHGAYFDLRALPWLSHQRPLVLDLRDAWLLTGHCAHTFDCKRWTTGCGRCPDLNIYPEIRRDGTAFNWQRKREIFAKSRVHVAAPSKWLMDKARDSILAPAIVSSRIIPTGIDLATFRPSEQSQIRNKLGLPKHAKILLFTANGIRHNAFKDYRTLRGAVRLLSERPTATPIIFVALGDTGSTEKIGRSEIRFVPHMKNPQDVASYYQAADMYLHASAADTFPRAVLEAIACGTPTVATAVGGIPEQIKSLENEVSSGEHNATGILVPPGDVRSMAIAIERLLDNESLLRELSENAARDARERFDLIKQTGCYLGWYREILCNQLPAMGSSERRRAS